MSRAQSRLVVPLGALALGSACAAGDEDSEAALGGLVLEESAAGVAGSYLGDARGRIEFQSRLVGDDVLDVEMELDGLVLSFLVDPGRGVVELDGYLAETGADAELTAEDRALLRELSRAIDLLGPDVRRELATARDLASLWSEFPSGMEMQFAIPLPEERGSASACAYLYRYVRGTHDGWWESNWSDRTTIDKVYLSMHSACRAVGDEDSQTTWWWSDGAWRCFTNEPNHSTSIEYAYGDCFGRCGSGCGSGTVFSWGCLDHDTCNRFGHSWSASLPGGHCADEFSAAAAQLISEPACLAVALERAPGPDAPGVVEPAAERPASAPPMSQDTLLARRAAALALLDEAALRVELELAERERAGDEERARRAHIRLERLAGARQARADELERASGGELVPW